jgi:hypothetical protein
MMLTKLHKRKLTVTPPPSASHLRIRIKVLRQQSRSFSVTLLSLVLLTLNISEVCEADIKPRTDKNERSVFDEAMTNLLIYPLVIRTSLKKPAFLYLSTTLWCQIGDGTI